MTNFTYHTIDTAPAGSKETLANVKKAYGFIPNLISVFAESPAAVKAYTQLGQVISESSLTPEEQQVLYIAISHINECTYCVAAHSTVAKMQNISGPVIEALRTGAPLPDSKLQTLRVFAQKIVENRGWVDDADVQHFLSAGYTKANVLDVLTAVSMKTLSNYTNHIVETELDNAFVPQTWRKAA